MTLIPVNFNDVSEPKPAPGGRYNLQILDCTLGETGQQSKNPGTPQFIVGIGFVDEPNVPNIRHYITLPSSNDEAKSANFKALLLKRFLVAFNVPFDNSGIDTERLPMEMVGATANLEVKLGEPNDKGNVYNNIVVPPLPVEGR